MLLPDSGYRLSFPGVDGLFGWVTVDEQPLRVYGAQEAGKKGAGYVEAKDGAEFKVVLADLRSPEQVTDSYSIRLNVDGQRVTGTAVDRHNPLFSAPFASSTRLRTFRGKRSSLDAKAPMQFGSLRLTDDDEAACTNEEVIKNLGNIQLLYCRVTNVRRKTKSGRTRQEEPKAVHEQAKKASALSHQTSFGAPTPSHAKHSIMYDSIDPKHAPFSAAEFLYRSRSLLQLEGLLQDASSSAPQLALPPSPPLASSSKPRLSHKRGHVTADDDEELTIESPSEVEARKRVKVEEVEQVEREKEERRKKGEKPEVIDLCDSD
ncbi:hypothetical protein JCM10213_002390 [Rhodosporidiobolus nylandii]